jgi:beta-ribofuranosylaminobenzene 5'-phosphate synthase
MNDAAACPPNRPEAYPEVHIQAPSRLHFGMFSIRPIDGRRFGGVGAMVGLPGLSMTLRRSERLEATGPLAARAILAARQAWAADPRRFSTPEPPCRIEILTAPPEHVGLGTGTQLSMAVAAGIHALGNDRETRLPAASEPLDAPRLARLVGRGERSAIGLYGFLHGGLLLDGGKADGEEISPLAGRVALPEAWRFVLVCPEGGRGLSGPEERQAFAGLPPVPPQRCRWLLREAKEVLLPAAAEGRFDEFSESLYQFGYNAGLSFAAFQGGPFAGPRLAALVDRIRALGVRGVGQSSWGPTIFALLPDHSAAEEFVATLRCQPSTDDLAILIAPPANGGATIRVQPHDSDLKAE